VKNTERLRQVVAVSVLLLIASVAFLWSLHLRQPYRNTETPDTYFSTLTLLFANHWYYDGVVQSGGALIWNPRSVEFPTLESRRLHSSYPPGVVLPVYVIARMAGSPPSLSLITKINLLNQLLIGLFLSLTIFCLMRHLALGCVNTGILSCIPVILVFFLPAPFYEHQAGFFTYQAVLPWFAAFVLLETLRDTISRSSIRIVIAVAQSAVAFLGLAADWLFAYVLACVYVKRILERSLGPTFRRFLIGSLVYWAAPAALLGLFALQLVMLNGTGPLYQKFLERASISENAFLSPIPEPSFWYKKMVAGYGLTGILLVGLSFVGVLATAFIAVVRLGFRKPLGRAMTRPLATAFILLVPCLMYTYVFRNQSAFWLHFCETLKFTLPISVIPFVLLPAHVFAWFRPRSNTLTMESQTGGRMGRILFSVVCGLLLLAAALYAKQQFPRVATLYATSISQTDSIATARFIAENTGYEDVVFTWQGQLEQAVDPFWLAYSMKRVYLVNTLADVCAQVTAISRPCTVNFLCTASAPSPPDPALAEIISRIPESCASHGLRLYKIQKEAFLAQCPRSSNEQGAK
jgi:hypothetical protein